MDEQSGWGVLAFHMIQAQREAKVEKKDSVGSLSLLMCGYCFHELGNWLCSEEDEKA